MANVAVIGAQWGDEGKGKVVDWLASRADVVVRFQGGHNAGHTLVVGNETYKLSLLPSGLVRGKLGIIGNGVVVDPWALLAEIERVGRSHKYILMDSYRNEQEKVNLLYWQLTCECFFTPREWEWLFAKCGYTGDYGCIFFE